MKWPAWSPKSEQEVVFGDTIRIAKMDVKRMDRLAAHEAKPMARSNDSPQPRD